LVTADDETVTFLEAGAETIAAIVTSPVEDPLGVGVIILPGGGVPLTTGRNRFGVRLCRSLAGVGFHTLRLDYHGAGESTGSIRQFSLDRPFVDDARAAIRFLRLQGVERFILVGSCFGSRTALAVAASAPQVFAVALISPPVRDFEMGQHQSVLAAERRSVWAYVAKGLHPRSLGRLTKREWRKTYLRHARAKLRTMDRGTRTAVAAGSRQGGETGVSGRFLADIRALAERRAPILLIYGSDEHLYDDFQRARRGELGDLLAADPHVTETVLDGSVHGFTNVGLQDAVLDVIVDWVRRTATHEIELDRVIR
jgi:pimeloyl-ACP methyl ester carboxylesterase